MDVQIVVFPETRVAAVEHFGPPTLEHETARKLIRWKLERRLLDPLKYRSYGVHYTDPYTTAPADHHVDFCLSFEEDVGFNSFGIINKVIPRNRCAVARDIGSRYKNQAAVFLYNEWLPRLPVGVLPSRSQGVASFHAWHPKTAFGVDTRASHNAECNAPPIRACSAFYRTPARNCQPRWYCVSSRLSHLRKTDHLLGFNVPNFQSETTKDFDWMERRSLGRLQLCYIFENFR